MQEGWDDEGIYTVQIPCLRHYNLGCGVGPARASRQHRVGVPRLTQPHSDLHGRTYWVSGKKVYLAFLTPVSPLIILPWVSSCSGGCWWCSHLQKRRWFRVSASYSC